MLRTRNIGRGMVAAPLLLATACGDSVGHGQVRQAADAPDAVRSRSEAVVHVDIAGGEGTGFFIEPSGHLVTNAHVLGPDSCAIDGCFVELTMRFEAGLDTEAKSAFVRPVAVDPVRDLSVWSVRRGRDVGNFDPGVAGLELPEAGTLEVGATVHALGHPYGGLMKWSRGEVFDVDERWIWVDALTAPGSSGSPVFDEDGTLVGVLARGGVSPGRDDLSAVTLLVPVEELTSLIAGGMTDPEILPDLQAALTLDEIRELEPNLFNSHALTVRTSTGGEAPREWPVTEALGMICDAGLAGPAPTTESSADRLLTDCVWVTDWFDCEASAKTHQSCPSTETRRAWTSRVQQAEAKAEALSPGSQWSIAYARAHIERGFMDPSFEAWVAPENPAVEAPYTAVDAARAIAWAKQKGRQLPPWAVAGVRDHRSLPGYARDAMHVMYGVMLLADAAQPIDEDRAKSIAKGLLRDPGLTMRTYMRLEHLMWRLDWKDALER